MAVFPVCASAIVTVSVVPSYDRLACITSPLCRFTPVAVRSIEPTFVGDAPSVYSPVESTPSPWLLYRSNFTATLSAMPPVPPTFAGP